MQYPISNSFIYNSYLRACNPGFLYNPTTNTCSPFTVSGADAFFVGTGVDYSANFPETLLSFDSIKKYTQAQDVFLGATVIIIIIWLLFSGFVRFGSVGDGRTRWFKIRWWISRLDIVFASRHWLDDQKVVRKRKTELGGAFSIASCILFIGLFAALLYQIISKRTIEVHSVVAANAPDLTSFSNNMEFNITTISTMSCSNIQNLGTLVTGKPGFLDFKTSPLSTFANFSCQNTTNGPMVTLKCNNCQLIRDNFYTSWQFIDLPNVPASAVGFAFNLTSADRLNEKKSFVSGILKRGKNMNAEFVTFRGKDPNILQFNLFPRIYRNKDDLKLMQPLFHEFLPGSSFGEVNRLRASLQNSSNGCVNISLNVNLLSSYIVEIDNQNLSRPVGFLADLGGLYCVSIGLFFYFLVQFEYRFKRFRNEDKAMRRIRNRKKAQERWDKLRKHVVFTSSRRSSPHEDGNIGLTSCCSGILTKSNQNGGSLSKRKQHIRKDTISFNKKSSITDDKMAQKERLGDVDNRIADIQQPVISVANDIPLPPSLESKSDSEISGLEIQKNIQKLYKYNLMLREELILAQSMLRSLTSNDSAPKGQ